MLAVRGRAREGLVDLWQRLPVCLFFAEVCVTALSLFYVNRTAVGGSSEGVFLAVAYWAELISMISFAILSVFNSIKSLVSPPY